MEHDGRCHALLGPGDWELGLPLGACRNATRAAPHDAGGLGWIGG